MNFQGFKLRLILSLVLISSVPLIAFAVVIYHKEAALVRNKALSHLESIVVQSVHAIERFKEERVHDLNLLSAGTIGVDKASGILQFRRMQTERVMYRGVFMTDREGKVLFSTGVPCSPERGMHAQQWFASVLKGDAFFGDVGGPASARAQNLLVAVPIKAGGEGITGVLGAIIDFQGMADAMKNVGIGKTGEIYLLNRDGVFLTGTRLGENRSGERVVPERFAQYFTQVGPDEYIDYRGKKVLRVYRELPDVHWVLVGEQDSSEVLAEISSLRAMFAAALTLLIFLVAVTGYFISARMIRLLKSAYEQKRELEMQVIQKDKLASMGLLTAGIAHELNTPLASALLYTQMMKEDLREGDTRFSDRLGFIEDEIKRGSRIIRNLLDFSRQSKSETMFTDINDALAKLLALCRQLCADRGIEVEELLAEGIPLVKGNADILHQVFMNIVANAIEAMETGGTLSVSTRFVQALHRVVVEVQDTGPGIPEEHLGDVFDPFFTTKPTGEGTGLGLAVSYSMVKKMGGDIRVTSLFRKGEESMEKPTGTTFTIELPAQEEGKRSEGHRGEATA